MQPQPPLPRSASLRKASSEDPQCWPSWFQPPERGAVRPEPTFLQTRCPAWQGSSPGPPPPSSWPGPWGRQEASPISTFHRGCFSVSHLPDFLQQTTLQSWVPPSSRGDRRLQGGCPARPTERRHCQHRTGGTGLGRFVYRLLLLRKLLSVTVILAQMSNKYAPT